MDINYTIIKATGITYDELYAVLPCIVLGIFCGVASYFQNYLRDEEFKPNKGKLVANGLTSAILSFVIFTILDVTDLSFMTKLSISTAVAFLGIDKVLDVVERLLRLGGGK